MNSNTNKIIDLLVAQLEECNDCMESLADTLRQSGHHTKDLHEQIERNKLIIAALT